jgi:hypothetical protein
MSMFGGDRGNTAHWSTDYVEHLRTVHFALIALTVTTIIIAHRPNTSDLRTAQWQLHLIRDFVENKASVWSTKHTDDERATWIRFAVDGKQYAVKYRDAFDVFERTGACPIVDPNSDLGRQRIQFVDTAVGSLSAANSVASFEFSWDYLNCQRGRHYDVVKFGDVVVFPRAQVVAGRPIPPARRIELELSSDSRSHLAKQGVYLLATRPVIEMTDQAQAVLQESASQWKALGSYNPGPGFGPERYGIGYLDFDVNWDLQGTSIDPLSQPSKPALILFDFFREDHAFDALAFLPIHESSWQCKGSFAQCFSELKRAAAGRDRYSFKDLSDWLDNQIGRYQQEDIEIFNIRFPIEDQARWGIILILALLSYLWLHLHELCPSLQPDHSGLAVAWVGLYSSVYAYSAILLTVAVLPLAAIISFGLSVIHYQSPFLLFVRANWFGLLTWIVIPSAACGLLSLLSCLQIHRLAALASVARNQDGRTETRDQRDTSAPASQNETSSR